MKRLRKTSLLFLLIAVVFVSCASVAFAHSGRTDGSGGHNDNKNASGLGSYHYHCGGYPAHLHTNGYCPYTDVFPTGVSISVEKKTLGIGESISFGASVWPSYACSDVVSWSCSDHDVISISGGEIQALNYGSATITATTFNGRTDSVTITVREITADYVTVTGALGDDGVYIGDTIQLTASITPENVDNPSISWSSDNKDVASVNNSGRVTAVAAGSAIISATASNGVVGEFAVDVKEKYVESVDIIDEELALLVQDTYPLSVSVLPDDATYPELEWSSSNAAAVEISEDGTLSAKRRGSAIITAISRNGISDSVVVSVSEVVAKRIEIVGEDSIVIGDEEQLTVKFIPEDTTVKEIEWSVSDPSIVDIDENGNIVALAMGDVTITATQKDEEDELKLQVIPRAVEKINISSSLGTRLEWCDTAELTAEVSPSDATYSDIDWESSNPSVAAVDNKGNLEAKAPGKAIITAKSKDGCAESVEISVVLSVGVILLIIAISLVVIAGLVFLFFRRNRRGERRRCAEARPQKRGYNDIDEWE